MYLRKKYPKARRKELILRSSYSYYWLWKHDGEWLEQHMPPAKKNTPQPIRVSWKQWDKKFSKTIAMLSAEITQRDGPLVRVSKEEIIKGLARRSWIEQHLDKLPKTSLALQKYVESREEFLIRRVRWAEAWFIEEGYCPTPHQFAVRAGTRTKSGSAATVQHAMEISLDYLNRHFGLIAA
jgi:hypothetical protein